MKFKVGQTFTDKIVDDHFKILSIVGERIFVKYENPLKGETYYTEEELTARITNNVKQENKMTTVSLIGKKFYKIIDSIKIEDESEKSVYFISEKNILFHMSKERFFKEYAEVQINQPITEEVKKPEPVVKNDKSNKHGGNLHYPDPTLTLHKASGRWTLSKSFYDKYHLENYKHVYISFKVYKKVRYVDMYFTNIISKNGMGTLHNITVNKSVRQISMKKSMFDCIKTVKDTKFTKFDSMSVRNGLFLSFKIGDA